MKRTCIQCGAEFEIEELEAAFFEGKGFELPKRCKSCRQKNKAAQREQKNNYYQNRNGAEQNYQSNYQSRGGQQRNYQPNYQKQYNNGQQSYRKNYEGWQKNGYTSQKNGQNWNSDLKRGAQAKESKLKRIIAFLIAVIVFLGGGGAWYLNQQSNEADAPVTVDEKQESTSTAIYQFRSEKQLEEHFNKHGEEMQYSSKEDYLAGANEVIAAADVLHKKQAKDGDDVYFLENTGELVVVSTDGYIRTYFKPNDGRAYYDRQ